MAWLHSFAITDSQAYKDIVMVSEEVNNVCPLKIGDNLELKEMSFNSTQNSVIMVLGMKTEFMTDIKSNPQRMEDMAHNIVAAWITSNDLLKTYCQNLAQVNASIKIHYFNPDTLDVQVITITPQQIKDVLAQNLTPEQVAANQLANFIANERVQIGQSAGLGMVITDIQDLGNYVDFVIECDENYFDMNEMQKNLTPTLMEGIISGLLKDPLALAEMKCFAENGRGVKYSYIGNRSGKKASATIPASRLYEMTHDQ